MNLAEYATCDGVELADRVRKKEASPKELAGLFVQAVERVNPRINAVIEVWSDRIATLDGKVVPDGPFAGVPLLMKDVGAGEGGRVQESGIDSIGSDHLSRIRDGYLHRIGPDWSDP